MSSECGRVSNGKVRFLYSHEIPQGTRHLSHIKAPPWRPNAEEYGQRTPQETARFVKQLLAQHPNLQLDQDNITPTCETGASSTDINAWYQELKQQATAQIQRENIRTTRISTETQGQILLYNLNQVKKVKQAAAIQIDLTADSNGQFIFNINLNNESLGINCKEGVLNAGAEAGYFGPILLKYGNHSYWSYNKETLSGDRVNPLQAARIIQNSGITCNDYILVWHKNTADVDGLEHLLSQADFHGVLPPNDHVLRFPYLFRHNLSLPKGVTYKLKNLFKIIFPTHPLRYSHHDALIDSKKTVMMALYAEKLLGSENAA
ncbi:hypothetical protein F5Y09DRAFT_347607 [Xylaria sp. FL1042]|nr:hypothetical protein F5Y09DRAFT_347607 [Xylaria sp. FL1042]